MTTLLTVEDLHADYGVGKVLHGIGFSVAEGEICAILGPNGAGKTTLLRALCGTIRTGGTLRLGDVALPRRNPESVARLGVAHVPEGRGTFAPLTVEENLRLGAYTRRERAGVPRDIERVYEYFPVLKQRRGQAAGSLSGGEQQMLAIGRALMSRPRLLLLDEPSLGLAPMITRELFEIVRTVNEEERMTVILVEQNAHLTLEFAHRAHVIETGRIVLSGTAEEIRSDEQVVAAYLGIEVV
ncbi:amino acid/amide ABC transporter ATP-binding protein 2, HAAT family [Actinokineospora alba]|uniref:Amino acid/amide ABC transporter ATP-binding protein 2, HAAT family n=1 Tax=Actinokineospora alba TaxID=504798 RepID=A0A1H0LSN4_9PSEU|nr:ABC transporter ATP-binding protein [Actinokineospora alba]TDP67443.1 branched-chain amino acid transport system ATP-binding protein [Actinokineospora alba]SDI96475.1 branched-chain amino acid transport system ATP-binding protein [Actinokineospora alba]SDO71269.1 amino acid/amide ABC transporter ATP-binding protein 2, HAAT family [Actinokineospora alba]